MLAHEEVLEKKVATIATLHSQLEPVAMMERELTEEVGFYSAIGGYNST